MPSLQTARRVANAKNNGAKTIGQIYKEQSDFLMEETFLNDIQTKTVYLYDFAHDDQPHLKDHMTYDNTTKTRVEAKFIVKSYQSVDKDQVDYYLQFRPSQHTEFVEGDDLYYFETDYRKKYGNDDFIGLYCDIPDDKGIYRKWLIVRKEIANQFVKFLILPINYQLMWIETKGQERIKRRMWSVLKMQSSYNSGLWTDSRFTSQENQNKVWLPLNPITEKIWYTNESSKNMRVLVSSFTDNAIAWQISKVENAQPLGVQKLTLYQDFFDQHRDYIEKDADGNIIGMWANYFDTEIAPTDPDTKPTPSPVTNILATITSSASTIKVGGSYRTLNIKLSNDSGEDITDTFGSKSNFEWHFEIDDEEYKGIIRNDLSFCQMKIKFPDDYDYVGKILTVYCTITNETITIESNKLQLEITD